MVGIAGALAVASTVASAFGKKGAKPAQSTSGFDALPDEVKKAWLETYLPKVLDNFNSKQYTPMPMKRVNKPSSVFDSQALADLQEYSDMKGGIFTPTIPQKAASTNRQTYDKLSAIMGGNGMQNLMYDSAGKKGRINTGISENELAPGGLLYGSRYDPDKNVFVRYSPENDQLFAIDPSSGRVFDYLGGR